MLLRMMDNGIWPRHKICVNDKKKSQGRKERLRPSQKGLELMANPLHVLLQGLVYRYGGEIGSHIKKAR